MYNRRGVQTNEVGRLHSTFRASSELTQCLDRAESKGYKNVVHQHNTESTETFASCACVTPIFKRAQDSQRHFCLIFLSRIYYA